MVVSFVGARWTFMVLLALTLATSGTLASARTARKRAQVPLVVCI